MYSHRAFPPSSVEKIRWRGHEVKEKRGGYALLPSVQWRAVWDHE
jgi:hypothetical protein